MQPRVILTTGQSNTVVTRSFVWPHGLAPNVKTWNLVNGVSDTHIGTAFVTPGNVITSGLSLVDRLARENTDQPVYHITVGWGSMPISHWMEGTAAPDMFAQIVANVEAALAAIGASRIDLLDWWEGESDAINLSQTYPFDFEKVMARFKAQSWFDENTPVIVNGFSPYATNPFVGLFGNTLRQTVMAQPATRTFVDVSKLPQTYWEPTEYRIHMTADGYYARGGLAYEAFRSGANSGFNAEAGMLVVKQRNETRTYSTTLAKDTEIRFYARAGYTYRATFEIIGQVMATGGLKWSLSGPLNSVSSFAARTLVAGLPVAEQIVDYVYPTNVTVPTPATGHRRFRLGIDAFIHNVAENGVVQLSWAQNASSADPAYIFLGSTVRVTELPAAG